MIDYTYWRKALAGEKPKMVVDDPQLGFYRSGVYVKEPNKARKRVGWSPVAIFYAHGGLTAIVDHNKLIDNRDKLNELWSYVAANPISEETYRAVAERGEPWPDSHEATTVPSIPVSNGTNVEASFVTVDIKEVKPSPLHVRIAAEIEAAAKLLEKYTVIDSDAAASKARSLQQRFLDLRGDAAKAYEEVNRPLLEEQKHIRGIWFPIRDRADEASNKLRAAMGAWEDTKRKAARIAAERAEAGQEGVSNVPPPSTQIRGGSGRAAAVTVKKVVTGIDIDKAFAQFRESADVRDLLMKLAQKAVDAGIPVDGATVEEKSVVK